MPGFESLVGRAGRRRERPGHGAHRPDGLRQEAPRAADRHPVARETSMPGPGIELVGAEETAEVMEVLQERLPEPLRAVRRPRLRRQGASRRGGHRRADRRAARARPPRRRLGRAVDHAPEPGHRRRRRGHRPGLHVRRLDLRDRLHGRDARSSPRSTRPSISIRPTSRPRSRRGRRRSWSSTCSAARPGSTSSRRSPTGTASRSSRIAPRPSGRPTRAAGSAASGRPARSASTSSRRSRAATAA